LWLQTTTLTALPCRACAAAPGRRAFAREGEDRGPGLIGEFLEALEQRVADDPDRYRWDYIEALVICRKSDAAESN
jgi:hypothetical protein